MLTSKEEKISSFWQKTMRAFTFGSSYLYAPPPLPLITDQGLFDKQTEIMKILAAKSDCLIVGWGSTFVLPRHRNMTTIFFHAPLAFRVQRVIELYKSPDEKTASEIIAESDEMRRKYIAHMTGEDWEYAGNYDLSTDTSSIPFEKLAELIFEIIKLKKAPESFSGN